MHWSQKPFPKWLRPNHTPLFMKLNEAVMTQHIAHKHRETSSQLKQPLSNSIWVQRIPISLWQYFLCCKLYAIFPRDLIIVWNPEDSILCDAVGVRFPTESDFLCNAFHWAPFLPHWLIKLYPNIRGKAGMMEETLKSEVCLLLGRTDHLHFNIFSHKSHEPGQRWRHGPNWALSLILQHIAERRSSVSKQTGACYIK